MSKLPWWKLSPDDAKPRRFHRRPLSYGPSGTPYNTERLPQAEDSNLAYRATALTDSEAARLGVRFLASHIVLVPLALFALLYTAALLGLTAVLLGVAIGLFAALIRLAFLRERSLRVLLATIGYPTGAALAGVALVAVIDNVPFAEFGSRYYTLIGYAAVVGLFALSLARFTWSWLHSDVRISSALRAQTYKKTLAQLFQQRATIDTTLLYSLYAFVPLASLLFALWGGARLDANIMASLPRGLAMLVGVAPFVSLGHLVCLAVWAYVGHFEMTNPAAVLGHFLSYAGTRAYAPGVWTPPSSLTIRRALFTACFAGGALLFLITRTQQEARSNSPVAPAVLSQAGETSLTEKLTSLLPEADSPSARHLLSIGRPRELFIPFGLCFALLPAIIGAIYASAMSQATEEKPSWSDWDYHVDRLQGSTEKAYFPAVGDRATSEPVEEREHLLLGFQPDENVPVLLHRSLLREHTYIVGDSGSGKTSLGILPLITQLHRFHGESARIVVLDLKGDRALFQAMHWEARMRGPRFLFFTPEEGQASHPFNPFPDFQHQSRSLSSFCTLLLDALSLNHGEGYGRGYFTARNRQLLYNLVKGHNPSSFAELYALMPKMNSRASQDAFELVAVLQMLADYPVLQVLPSSTTGLPDSESIHMARLLEEGEIAYFWLPAAIESISVREIGKLAIFSLLSAAVARQQEGKPTVPVYLVIDEFQRIAGENFSILLEQARSFGIHLILANQTISDLNTHSKDLRPTVRTNTRTKFFFSVTEPDEIRALSSLSGEALIELSSRSVSRPADTWGGQRTETMSLSEKIIPRLTTQDIQRHSDHPEEFILHVSRGSGFSQFAGLPIAVRALRPMPRDKHDYFSAEPWPTEPFVTPPSPPPSAAPASPTQPAPAVPNVGQAAPPPPPAQPVGAPPKGQQPGTPPTGQASPPPSASSAAGQSHGPSAATGQKAHKTPAQKDEERLAEARRYFNDLIGRHIIDAGYYEIRRAEPPERDEKARTHDENVRDLFDEQGES